MKVVVVGAGLAGSATAWRLAQRGDDVTLVEAFSPAHPGGSSHGSARIFRHAYPDRFHAELTVRALEGWRELEAESGEPVLRITGGLDFGAQRDLDGIAASLASLGLPHERLSADAARERFPHITFTGPAVYHPGAGVLDADLAVRTMVDRAELAGATVLVNSPVLSVGRVVGGWEVRLADRTITADRVVLTVGAWLPEFLNGIAFPPLTVSQQQAFFFAFPEQFAGPWPIFVYKDEASVYALPGGYDVGGAAFKIAEHDGKNVTTARDRDGIVQPEARERIIRWVEANLPGVDPTPVGETTCLYTSTPSEDFVIDSVDGLVIASPCSGHGAKFAPLLGELIADVAHGGTAPRPFQLASHLGPSHLG